MNSFSIFHWYIVLLVVGIPLLIIITLLRSTKSRSGEIPNTWKFRTIIFLIFAFVIPFWLITLPLFLYLAYRSYKAGDDTLTISQTSSQNSKGTSHTVSVSKAEQLTTLYELLKSGALTQEEFDSEKRKILGTY